MKTFEVWRTRLWPQCYIGVIKAKDGFDALTKAKEMGILNPIIGEVR